jgi:hypothetical protein
MQIIPVYDAAANADANFRNDIQAAINILDAVIASPITVRIDIEKGEYKGQDIASMVVNGIHLTQSISLGYINDNPMSLFYTTLRGDLINSVPNFFNLSNLPNSSNVNGNSSFVISSSQERLFGINDARLNNSSFVDGYVGIGTNFTAGNVRISAALHEIGHALGRVGGSELDLFRFISQGNRLFGTALPAPPAYFSLDGGLQRIANWGQTSDPEDFLNDGLTVNDPFAEVVGNLGNLTTKDLQVMAALGFRVAAPIFGNDNPIALHSGGTVTISRSSLSVSSPTNVFVDTELTYTIVTAPTNGTLLKNLSPTSSFTQTDINNGLITYHETASNVSSDFFLFYVTDPVGNRTANAPFQFQISPPPDTTVPVPIWHNPLSVSLGGIATISANGNLAFGDPDNSDSQLTYTIVAGPSNGTLLRNGTSTSLFTQADIDNGLIAYHETASNVSSDSFVFYVSDPAGNRTVNTQFQIQISNSSPIVPAIGDFNGDGSADMVLHRVNQKGNLEFEGYLINNNHVVSANVLGEVGFDWKVAGFGTLNGDNTDDMVLTRINQKANREFEGYLINNDHVVSASLLGEVGNEWAVAGLGDLNGDHTDDMVLTRINQKANREFEGYLINNDHVVSANLLGEAGNDWKVAGFTDLNGDGIKDMVLSRTNQKGNLEFEGYLISNNHVTTASLLAEVGNEWAVVGFGDLNGDKTGDMVLSRTNQKGNLEFEGYLISNNHVVSANLLGEVGNEWSAGGSLGTASAATQDSGSQPAAVDPNLTAQLVQVMAGFGSGAADGLNTAPLTGDTSQQTLLTTPVHA